jgi:NAD-dependent dihydropyrimidine dehydrogenase PreA subunit
MLSGMPEIDLKTCTGCGDCVEWCSRGAVAMRDGKAMIITPARCHYCTDCEEACPAGAIQCPFEIILVHNAATE